VCVYVAHVSSGFDVRFAAVFAGVTLFSALIASISDHFDSHFTQEVYFSGS